MKKRLKSTNKTTYSFSRRDFIKSLGIMGLSLPFSQSVFSRTPLNAVSAFVVPPLAKAIRKGKQVTFNLKLNESQHHFFEGINTPTLGINQSYLGPILRAKRGDNVTINVTNHLNEVSTLHWHGMSLPAKMDGGPHQAIQPGKTWQSRFNIDQEASTLWYHSHAMHKTGKQVYHGLAGLFILDDEGSDKLGLPNEYGIDDIPCTIQDRRFYEDGSFSYIEMMHDIMMGMQGDTMLVNGIVTPTLNAQRTLLRLRLHNGSNARIYDFTFSDNRPFHIVAGDCGFLEHPVSMRRVTLAPAERAEILVDVSDRKIITLQNKGSEYGDMDIMTIDAREAETSTYKIPHQLRKSSVMLNPKKAITTRHFNLEMGMMGGGMMGSGMGRDGMFRINGQSMDMNRIDFKVKRNTTEIWEIGNDSPMPHPFHVHDVQFQILSRNGRPPMAYERGLKDTVLVDSGEVVRIIMHFPDHSDANTPYMYHCHILEHEDQGMMGQFVVV